MREGAKDRISGLPDPLLHQIHSFLGTKEGARTSVLSKRWNHIWTTVPVLEFWNRRESSSETYKFINFVDGTLHRHSSSNMDKFSLSWNWQLEENDLFEFVKDRVHSWISTVAKRNVKDLSLCLYQKDPWFVPLSLFTSQTLVSLQLQIDPSIRFPKYICLTRLKRLELRKFELSDESWNDQLFSNSTVLEELILDRCTYGMRDFCISIPSLKVLEIDTWRGGGNGIQGCVFEIDAPKLVTFSYSGYAAKEFVLSSFPALAEAAVFFPLYVGADQALSQLLRALGHVKCLTVSDRTLQAIYSAYNLSNSMPTFHNVKMLKISNSVTTDQGLIALLKAVPNLESLVFHRYMNDEEEDSDEDDENDSDEDCSDDAESDADDDNDDIDVADPAECRSTAEFEGDFGNDYDSWVLDTVTTECLFSHLKSVCFQQFGGCPREMKWVRLILRKAKALQMMTIRYYHSGFRFVDAKSEKELLVEIPNFTRASAGCMLKFCS